MVIKRYGVIVSTLCVLSLAACGGSSSSGSGGKTVNIGYMANLTGAAGGEYGVPYSQGLKLGFDEVAKSGYLSDSKLSIKVTTTDVASLVPNAVTAFNKFAQAGDKITISDSLSTIGKAVAPLANAKKVVLVSGAGSELPNDAGFAFHLVDLVTPMKSLGKKMRADGVKRVAVIVNGDNPSFKTLADAMVQGMSGAAPIASETVSDSTTDFSSVLTNIKAKNPDAVFISALPQQSGNLVAQLKQAGGLDSAKLYGSISWGKQTYDIAKNAVVGCVFAQEWSPGADTSKKFEAAYQAAYKTTPGAYSALGYQSAWLIAIATKQAAGSGEVTSESVRDQLPSASTSSDMQNHGVIPGFNVAKSGATTYDGTLTTFTNTGELVSAK